MNIRLSALLFLAALLITVAGCGSAPVVSDSEAKAIKLATEADSEFKAGNYQRALKLYEAALNVDYSYENEYGIGVNIINIARVYREIAKPEDAHRFLEMLLENNTPPFSLPNDVLAEAAFLNGLIYFEGGNQTAAAKWADTALNNCIKSCTTAGKIYNLKARLALDKKQYSEALLLAKKGAELNKAPEQKNELSNSFRIMAKGYENLNKFNDAVKYYTSALQIDKALGEGQKVAADLMGLGTTFLKEGNKQEAQKYFQRALLSYQGLADEKGIATAEDMLKSLNVNDSSP
ncbi:MAG: tetratricopeptide repeat protein [Nitrospirae bacterium]|nr:tetratricopeptide repeat protein [Nitrospirota bacterium]MBF0536131.1 tetratricopeptide repeat protein [Nitrospirota bacterium]MBF0618417.1 tetratricopeptide repeat protein [Nitrospirota bacterium]